MCGFFILLIICCIVIVQSADLPNLQISGFAWAENLAFDGIGNLFVSENTRGEIWRISLCNNGTEYCKVLHASKGLSSVGGMQITPNSSLLYAGGTLDDGTFVLLSAPTKAVGSLEVSYTVVTKTKKMPNGAACDWKKNLLYYTMEGSVTESGALMAVDLTTGIESLVYGDISGADGAWFDPLSTLLYIGLLTEAQILVFNTSNAIDSPSFVVGKYAAFSSLGKRSMLDDLTLVDIDSGSFNGGSTMMLGADWLGCALKKFSLDGTQIEDIAPPAGVDSFHQVTSVRWGRGPGFDGDSIYISEGGSLMKKQTDRRVIQIKMK